MILNQNTIERIIQSTDFNQAVSILNDYLAPFLKSEPLSADAPRKLEIRINLEIQKFIRTLSRFSFGSMANFKMILVLYLEMNRLLQEIRNYYKNPAGLLDKKTIPPIFHETLNILEKKHRDHPIIYYESQLMQNYIDESFRILDKIGADDRSFKLLQGWVDLYNLSIINNLAFVYHLSSEEIKTYLIQNGTEAIIMHTKELIEGTCPDRLSRHPMISVLDISTPQLNELKFKSVFYEQISHAIGGIPFRFSYCLAFFFLLQLESNNIRLLFNGHYQKIDAITLKDMVIAYPCHRE